MEDVFQAIKSTVCEDAQIQCALPNFLHTTVDLFGKAHLYYRAFKSYAIFQRAETQRTRGQAAVYGAALHLLSDYSTVGSYALKVVLVTKCAEDLLHQYRQLHQAHRMLQQAFYRHFPLYRRREWTSSSIEQSTFLSPSFQLWWNNEVMECLQLILKVMRCASSVLWEAFKLSMCLRDAYLLANGDPQAKYEALTELVADWERYRQQLQEDGTLLRQEIVRKQALADRILAKLEADKTTTFILSSLEIGITTLAEAVEPHLFDMQQTGEQTLEDLLPMGKIASLQIDLAEGQAFISTLPAARYPPWSGQAVEILQELPQQTPTHSLVEHLLQFSQDVGMPVANSLQGLLWLTQQAQETYRSLQKNIFLAPPLP